LTYKHVSCPLSANESIGIYLGRPADFVPSLHLLSPLVTIINDLIVCLVKIVRSGELHTGFFGEVNNFVDPRAALLGEFVVDLFTTPSDEHEKDCAEISDIRVRLEDVLLLERVDGGEGEITDYLADALALLGVIAYWKS
jgi:hypothetical protein